MLTGWKRGACVFLSLFFGVGTALFQMGYLAGRHRLNPFTLADLFVSFFMLVSVAGMLRRRPWGDFLNALSWAVPLCGMRLRPHPFCVLPGCRFAARRGDCHGCWTPDRAFADCRASCSPRKAHLGMPAVLFCHAIVVF